VPELSRTQVIVYAAAAVALLLVGARAIRSEPGSTPAAIAAPSGEPSPAGSEVNVSDNGVDIVVDVAGAVARPGVYRLPGGSRVVDAVQRAGGPIPGALLEAINRAARLTDGQQVVVPGPDDGAAVAAGGPGSPEAPISLGSATVEQLETIDGIGPVTAEKIVEYRNEQGGLASVEQLDAVSGIGPATLESLRARLQP
jgi:competence protein ComEA